MYTRASRLLGLLGFLWVSFMGAVSCHHLWDSPSVQLPIQTVQGRVEPMPSSPVIRMGCSYDWAGWWPWAVARQQHLFEKHDLQIELQWFDDYYEALDALEEGKLDANCQVFNDTLERADRAINGEAVVLVTDYSDGNDKIIVSGNIETLHDLVGQRVGVEQGKLTDFLLTLALERNDIDRENIDIKYLDTAAAVGMFLARQLEAVVTWQPDWLMALKRPSSYEILNSADLPGAIPQVLAVSQTLVSQNPDVVKRLVNTWFETLKFIQDQPAIARDIMLTRSQLSETQYQTFLDGVYLLSRDENITAFDPGETLVHLGFLAQKVVDFLVEAGQIERDPNLEALLDGRFIKTSPNT